MKFDYEKFAKDVEKYKFDYQAQERKNISLRKMAKLTSVDYQVIYRLFKGHEIGTNSLIKLSAWANLNIGNYVVSD